MIQGTGGADSKCELPLPIPVGALQGNPEPDPSTPALLRLSDRLLAHYRRGVRPVRDWRTTTTVAIDVMVYAILSVVSLLSFHPSADGKPRGSQPASSLPPHSIVLLFIPLQKE